MLRNITLAVGAVFVASAASATSYVSSASFMAAAPTSALLENFESVPPSQVGVGLTNLVRPGITFTPITADLYVAPPGTNNFGASVGATTSNVLTADGNENFRGVLASTAGAVGFDVLLNGLGPLTVSFFNNAALVDTIVFSSGSGYAFAGSVSSGGITSFTFTATGGGQLNTGVDNIRAAPLPATVPEPATWAMMLIGFGGMGYVMRRNRMVALSLA